MPKQRERTVRQPLIRPHPWYTGRTTAQWLGALREFLLEHRDADIPIDEMRCEALRELERESRTWLQNLRWLLDFRLWDIARLRARDPAIAKPRIDLFFEVTSKDNLSVRWTPSNWMPLSPNNEQDFAVWQRHPYLNDYEMSWSRPNNEIAFIRGVGRLELNERPSLIGPFVTMRNRLLIYATRAFVMEIEEFLRQFLEVSTLTAFAFALDSKGQVTDWQVDDVDELWVRDFEKNNRDIPLELFCRLCRDVRDEDSALAKRLREEGFPEITVRQIRSAIDEFRLYRSWDRFRLRHRNLVEDNVGKVVKLPPVRQGCK